MAQNIISFNWQPARPVTYEAGQFIQMHLPHPNPDDRGTKRWFTLSSSPTEPLLTNTTKFATDRSSSFKKTLHALEVGAEIEMDPPEGDFTLVDDPKQPLVFVAGGIGVTPYHSIIKYLADKKQSRPIQLLYAANVAAEFAFRDLFDNTKAISEVKYMVKQPDPDWQGGVGVLSAAKIKELADGLEGKLVYLSGPEPMVEALEEELKKAGIAKEQLKGDFFPNYKAEY